jgi:hypothetical protein
MSKDRLRKLYNKCGDILHRGSLNDLLSATKPARVEFAQIQTAIQDVLNLLKSHVVALFEPSPDATGFVCLLHADKPATPPQIVFVHHPDFKPEQS